MRWIVVLALALCGGGCGALNAPVPLLTGELGCYAGGESGPTAVLVADPQHGATFAGRPVMWPAGYTGRRVGGEVVISDALGRVKATTGRTYHISFAWRSGVVPGNAGDPFPAAVDCGYPWDFVDCTANPTDQYCKEP